MGRQYFLVTALMMAVVSLPAQAVTVDDARAKGLAWMVRHQAGDGSWVDSADNQITSTAVATEALALSGVRTGYVAGAAATWLLNAESRSVDALARQITALSASGIDTKALVARLLAAKAKGQGGALVWGAYPGYTMGMPDTALALEALLAAGDPGAAYTVAILKQMARTDGGWGYGSPQLSGNSSLIATAQAVRVLAIFTTANPGSKAGAEAAVSGGINWLLARKKNDGGFAEDATQSGTNDLAKMGQVLETALVWNTLSAAKQAGYAAAQTASATSTLSGAETFLLAKQNADGAWGNDALQTAAVLQMWGRLGTLADTDHDGVPDAVEQVLGSNTSVADARELPKGNGNPVSSTDISQGDNGDVPLPPWSIATLGGALLTLIERRRRASPKKSTPSNSQESA